ncbi:hypothetical protein [Microbacterium timonense]|uniref:hypothetical protein n=1 Tax=Microbacterium timonense TaxID=2086576 RepID=UPI000D0F66DD|nr:hypothetical protein [Microbacterium timonense]
MNRRTSLVTVILAMAIATLSACGTTAPGTSRTSGMTPTPTPTAACPEQPGVELPPECAPYDPDAAMAQNDLYRQRIEMDEASKAAGAALLADATAALQSLQAGGGSVTGESVRAALEQAGAADVQIREGAGDVLFGAAAPGGGCVYGDIDGPTGVLTIDLGGIIMDGGCLPAQ